MCIHFCIMLYNLKSDSFYIAHICVFMCRNAHNTRTNTPYVYLTISVRDYKEMPQSLQSHQNHICICRRLKRQLALANVCIFRFNAKVNVCGNQITSNWWNKNHSTFTIMPLLFLLGIARVTLLLGSMYE